MRTTALTTAGLLTITSALFCSVGCGSPSESEAAQSADIVKPAHEFATADGAPYYDGEGFSHAQILRLSDGVWLDEVAFGQALASVDVTYFGEQHQTAPVQALQRWVMKRLDTIHPDEALAMEHFQRDEQPIIDRYFRGEIDQATFEATAQVWPGYETYWRPLVEDAKAAGRPLFGLNVPKEVLSGLYGQFPTWPFEAFNDIPTSSSYDWTLPARPLIAWTNDYQGWFETSFDYEAHGSSLGLSYPDALHYFTDLAHIRDETMARSLVDALATTPHVFVVAGDWHIQTRLAVPERVTRIAPTTSSVSITTAPAANLDDVRGITHAGRPVADYIITYVP